jgi:hypothetical protein
MTLPQTGLTAVQPYMRPFAPTAFILPATDLPALNDFVQSVMNGNANQVVGVYVPGTVALPIIQQPRNDANFVSRDPEIITQFDAASRFKTIGLLAHNYLAGTHFYNMRMDQVVIVVYGNGRLSYYRISEVQQFQALTPNSPQSDFLDLGHPNSGTMSAGDLFNRMYTQGDRVVFQTCILANGDSSWGRMFVIATPLEAGSVMQQSPLRARFLTLF